MKKSITFLFLLVSGLIFAGKGLIVTQKYNSGKDGQQITVTWYITETQCKLKMQFSDKDVNTTTYFIPDMKNNQLLSYSDAAAAGAQKTYYGIPVQNIKAEIEPLRVERTGEAKTISGINCEKIIARSGSTITEMWVTKDFNADYYRFASFFRSSYELKALSGGSMKGFPLSSVTKDNTGKVINSYELVSVSSVEIADSEFVVPAEYKSSGSK